jgi:hypothetical protein
MNGTTSLFNPSQLYSLTLTLIWLFQLESLEIEIRGSGEMDPADSIGIRLLNSAMIFNIIIRAVEDLILSYEDSNDSSIKRLITFELETVRNFTFYLDVLNVYLIHYRSQNRKTSNSELCFKVLSLWIITLLQINNLQLNYFKN